MRHPVPDLCHNLDWNPIAAAASQSAIAAVLAGFVFAGIIVVLSVRAHSVQRESALALKLLLTAFFGLAVTAYFLADLAGEQTCARAETTEALAGGSLGTFSVITIAALTWLVVAYKRHEQVLGFLHALVYVASSFVTLLLCTSATSYINADLPHASQTLADVLIYTAGGLFLTGGALWLWWYSRTRRGQKPHNPQHIATTSDTVVNYCVGTALAYLAVSSVATGVSASLPPRMWYCGCRKSMPPGDIHESRLRRGRAAGTGSGPGQ
jgi:hypothetical protein